MEIIGVFIYWIYLALCPTCQSNSSHHRSYLVKKIILRKIIALVLGAYESVSWWEGKIITQNRINREDKILSLVLKAYESVSWWEGKIITQNRINREDKIWECKTDTAGETALNCRWLTRNGRGLKINTGWRRIDSTDTNRGANIFAQLGKIFFWFHWEGSKIYS